MIDIKSYKITIFNDINALVYKIIIKAFDERSAIEEMLKQVSIVCGDKITIDEE